MLRHQFDTLYPCGSWKVHLKEITFIFLQTLLGRSLNQRLSHEHAFVFYSQFMVRKLSTFVALILMFIDNCSIKYKTHVQLLKFVVFQVVIQPLQTAPEILHSLNKALDNTHDYSACWRFMFNAVYVFNVLYFPSKRNTLFHHLNLVLR